MATQLKQTDFASTTALTPRPNIKVVFTAGDAALAVHRAAAEMPEAALTLEEMTIGDQAAAVIAQAEQLLSPFIYSSFLNWGACASRFASRYDDDDQGNMLCNAAADAIHAVASTDAINLHDSAFKVWLLILEAADAPGFGPLHDDPRSGGTLVEGLVAGVHADVVRASPLVIGIEQLSRAARKFSGSSSGWEPRIGSAIAAAFTRATAANGVGTNGEDNSWEASLGRYLTARAMADQCPIDEAAGDALVDAYCAAMDYLIITVPAPTTAALNLKMQLVKDRQDGFEMIDEYMDAIRRDVLLLAAKDVATPAAADPHPALLAERDRLLAVVNGWSDSDYSEESEKELIGTSCTIDNLILSMPATSQEGVLAKLLLLAQIVVEGHEPPMDWWVSAITSAQSVTGMGSTAAASNWVPPEANLAPAPAPTAAIDADLINAFTTYRDAFVAMRALPGSTTNADQDGLFAIMDPATETLLSVDASSAEGAIAKLRHAFVDLIEGDWADDAVIDPTSARFAEGLRMEGICVRMMWSAIEDLTRIAGINLTEQGR